MLFWIFAGLPMVNTSSQPVQIKQYGLGMRLQENRSVILLKSFERASQNDFFTEYCFKITLLTQDFCSGLVCRLKRWQSIPRLSTVAALLGGDHHLLLVGQTTVLLNYGICAIVDAYKLSQTSIRFVFLDQFNCLFTVTRISTLNLRNHKTPWFIVKRGCSELVLLSICEDSVANETLLWPNCLHSINHEAIGCEITLFYSFICKYCYLGR